MVAIARNPNNPWEIDEKYDGGAVKSYRHRVTGQIVTARQYRRLRDNGFWETEAFDEPPELDASADVEVSPPPPQRSWQTYTEAAGKTAESLTGNLWQQIMPGLYSIARGGSKIVLARMEREDIADYIPPSDIVKPVLRPAARIIDRHFPLPGFSAGGDIADIVAMVAATDKLVDYWAQVTAQHQEALRAYYEQYGDDEQPDENDPPGTPTTGRSDRTASGRERKPATGARAALERFGTWRDAVRQDAGTHEQQRRSNGRDAGRDDGHDSTGNGNASQNYPNDKTARNAASIRNLLEYESQQRLDKGLG